MSERWQSFVITTNQESKRFEDFRKNNSHLTFNIFNAIVPDDLDHEKIISTGLGTKELLDAKLASMGTFACAASHRKLREACAVGSRGYLILEDDCITHESISLFIEANLENLMNFDICFFGINTDSVLQHLSPEGLGILSLFRPEFPSQEWIRSALNSTSLKDITLHRFYMGFGNLCYFISPDGARKINEYVFPLSLETTAIPLINPKMPSSSLDRAQCRTASKYKAFVTIPFLAYSPNTDSETMDKSWMQHNPA